MGRKAKVGGPQGHSSVIVGGAQGQTLMGREAKVGGPQGHSSLMGTPIFLDSGALACTAQAKSEDDANTLVVNPVKGVNGTGPKAGGTRRPSW